MVQAATIRIAATTYQAGSLERHAAQRALAQLARLSQLGHLMLVFPDFGI